jgi:F1F0 ATPase subunit 2
MDAQPMTGFYLGTNALLTLEAIVWLISGALLGSCYFLTLRWNVHLLALGRAPLLAIALQPGRLALLAAAFAAIVRQFGALPLLLVTAGVLAARMATIRMGSSSD